MDKLEYIPGDLVKFATNTYTIVNFEENFLHNKICYALISTNSTKTAFVADRDILPIPLTPEILEKNGWDKDNSKFDEYDDDSEYDNRYFNWAYDLTLDLDDCSVYKGTSGILYGLLSEVKYVHQLQHLLFGLGVNHDMEV